MPERLSREQHRRGTRQIVIGGLATALIVGVGLTIWPWLQAGRSPPATGLRTGQAAGESTVGKFAPATSVAPLPPATVGPPEIMTSAAKADMDFDPAQRAAVDKFAAGHAQELVNQVDLKIAVGAAVPGNVELRDIPLSLVDALSAYSADQYFLAPKQFVIVDKANRRILAIVPVGGG